jgi:hypothetical protein
MLPSPEKVLLKPEKVLSKHQKIPNKNLARTSRHCLCTRQVSRKTDNFCVLHKKDNKMFRATPIFAPNFFFLHTTQKMSFFHETTL